MAHVDSPKYEPFHVLSTSYKTVHSHPIEVHTLIPKTLDTSSPVPIIVKFHGGFLITGDALYPDWFPSWLINYVLKNSAIVVAPNHRLLPEATGAEIMEDLHDFWKWLHNHLETYLKGEAASKNVTADFSKILVAGESAGGYLSIQSALGSAGAPGTVKACIATYPVLDIKSRFYSEEYEKSIFGAPTLPKDILANYLKQVRNASDAGSPLVVTSATPPERVPFALSMVQQGLYPKLMGQEKILYPYERIEEVKKGDLPPTFICHGRDDSAVPVDGSERWVEKVNARFGQGAVELVIQPGEHGFDGDESITLDTPWLRDGLARITKAWLGQ
jgi:acetyl esterase/lipase